MLCLASFFLETHGSETEGLVMRNKIEYSFEKHLGKSARKKYSCCKLLLLQQKPRCLGKIYPLFMEESHNF